MEAKVREFAEPGTEDFIVITVGLALMGFLFLDVIRNLFKNIALIVPTYILNIRIISPYITEFWLILVLIILFSVLWRLIAIIIGSNEHRLYSLFQLLYSPIFMLAILLNFIIEKFSYTVFGFDMSIYLFLLSSLVQIIIFISILKFSFEGIYKGIIEKSRYAKLLDKKKSRDYMILYQGRMLAIAYGLGGLYSIFNPVYKDVWRYPDTASIIIGSILFYFAYPSMMSLIINTKKHKNKEED